MIVLLETCVLALMAVAASSTESAPQCLDDRLVLELFAAEPAIVTPTASTVDAKGNPLVIECHTHFRPKDYDGPPADRIRRFEDTDDDGKADRVTTFWEGSSATMGIGRHPTNGWTYVATRDMVFRLGDADGDGVAEQYEELVTLKSEDNYPHAGISGFAFDAAGDVFFGLGENHAKPFTMTAKGVTRLSGIEGGHVYRIKPDGSKLSRVSIGCWNPFHLTFDSIGRLFVVDNDPDSLPPCRLLHIVEGGDYGYKYRNGRKGTHPYTAWNGELPGTLPMVAGTGEAPSGVLACGKGDKLPGDYRGDLLVTSWGDHRIERYVLKPRGASVSAERIDVVKGGEDFRPVGITVGGDGAIYFTDWVDKSYELHKKGRIWRLHATKADAAIASNAEKCPKSNEERLAERLRCTRDSKDTATCWDASQSEDPFLAQAGREGIAKILPAIDLPISDSMNAKQRLATELVMRSRNVEGDLQQLPKFLKDPDPDVRFVALQWIGEERLKAYRDGVETALASGPVTQRLFAAWLATKEKLDRPPRRDSDELAIDQYLADALIDANTPIDARVWALRSLRSDHPALTAERLSKWIDGDDPPMQMEAVRTLRESSLPERQVLLTKIANDVKSPSELRAAAIVGLSCDEPTSVAHLLNLAYEDDHLVQMEALRSLRGATLAESDRTKLVSIRSASYQVSSLVDRLLSPNDAEILPDAADLAAWSKILDEPGDAAAGERVFFHAKSAACNRCHQLNGRGATIGPDLTMTSRRLDRSRLIESILTPSKEVAPQFVPWAIETADGRALTGMLVGASVDGAEHFADSKGAVFTLKPDDIESRKSLSTSIMPDGLVKLMTVYELRDLLTYLQQNEQERN